MTLTINVNKISSKAYFVIFWHNRIVACLEVNSFIKFQKHTNISINEIEKAMERDRFFDPEEALKFGLIDKVITNREDK